jgi:hypothetical protein
MRGVRAMGLLLCAAALGGCAEAGWPAYSSPYAAYGGGYGGYAGAPWYSSPYPYYNYGYFGGVPRGFHHHHQHASPPPAAAPAPRPPAPPPPPAGSQAAGNQRLLYQLGVRPN